MDIKEQMNQRKDHEHKEQHNLILNYIKSKNL